MMLFRQGDLAGSQKEAELGCLQFQISNPAWVSKFQLLEAHALTWQGKIVRAQQALAEVHSSGDPEVEISKDVLEGMASTHEQQYSAASQSFARADGLCQNVNYAVCGDLLGAHGVLAGSELQTSEARRYMLASLAFARAQHDEWREARALWNLGWLANTVDQYDEAVDWLSGARRISEKINAKFLLAGALGNLGIDYYELGDTERGLEMFVDAEKRAAELGDHLSQIRWLENIGLFYMDKGDAAHAAPPFQQALDLAQQIDSKQDKIYSLFYLGYAAVEAGQLEQAEKFIGQLTPLVRSSEDPRMPLFLMQIQGNLASAKHQDLQAKTFYRAVDENPASLITMRLQVGLELARLLEREGRSRDAESVYKAKLAMFESARAQLKHEDSKLPFMANAEQLYDGYIHLLVQQGRNDEALSVANQSRARTLEQGLNGTKSKNAFHPVTLDPGQIAQKEDATLLFYWLGEKESYLWAITPQKTRLFRLPAKAEIAQCVERYRKSLLEMQDPLEGGPHSGSSQDGRALYATLVAPASPLIRRDHPVMILADGALTHLNFETLLAPGPALSLTSDSAANSSDSAAFTAHYWIDDVTILSAPSLSMLAAAKPDGKGKGSLLLMGDAVPDGDDYPELPMAGTEMQLIQKHFNMNRQAVFAHAQATPAAYISSSPEKFSYIHFVTHGTASISDPLDSAIILSRSAAADNSFKLYAHEILKHPIGARLVTISACYGSGTRNYVGEGLVGLSWAFLRAGAHNVIAAQWEVSDNATPRLMDNLYKGLEAGLSPSTSLRAAKLTLLHSSGNFRAPFFWASFQIFTGH